MDIIVNEPTGFQQTRTTRATDPAQDANPPPPPPQKSQPDFIAASSNSPVDARSPHPFRGQNLNTTV